MNVPDATADDECGERGAVRRAEQGRGDAREDGGHGRQDQRPPPVHRCRLEQRQAGELGLLPLFYAKLLKVQYFVHQVHNSTVKIEILVSHNLRDTVFFTGI